VLELRPNCECCNKDLPPAAADAMICSFECTFCRDCAETTLTEDAYNLASSIEAVRRYQGALAALRAATRSAIRPAPAPANPRPSDR